MNISYKDSGVDIDAGNSFVNAIKPSVAATFNPNVIGGIGSFAGAYALPAGYKEPVLLAATDGVGTKLKLAIESQKLQGVGIDLVAMCVNDLICNFADPLFFLDYYATGKLDSEAAAQVVEGIAQGCLEAECALIGGETAEMPGMYGGNDFDLAGFSVGIAERGELDRPGCVRAGDLLIALPSSGIHSNGYSLVRKLLFEKLNLKFDDKIGEAKLIDLLLEPTRIYVKLFKRIKPFINAMAHITGGGIVENLPRVLPPHLHAMVVKDNIRSQELFSFMGEHVSESEMFRTFNMGVGMVLAVDKAHVDRVLEESDGYPIGEVVAGNRGVTLL